MAVGNRKVLMSTRSHRDKQDRQPNLLCIWSDTMGLSSFLVATTIVICGTPLSQPRALASLAPGTEESERRKTHSWKSGGAG